MARPKPKLTKQEINERQAKWVQNWREKYPEKQILARKRAYRNRKLKAILKVGEARCVRCGCDEIDFLEFNHINGGGCKEHRDSKNSPMMDRILTNKRDVTDLEIVCRVCNALDFLERKNNLSARRFLIIWEK